MISNTMLQALNEQINEELFSAYLYMAMSAYFQDKNLSGFANWMEVQALEEFTHAKKFYDYIVERGGRVALDAIKKPQGEWKSPEDAIAAAYGHEQHISGCINRLMDLALSEKDHASVAMLQWFVTEQVEEEASADAILSKLKMVSGGNGLFYIDRELGKRVFSAPAAKED